MKTIHTIEEALEILSNDGVIAYPTETFFGIGCSAYSQKGIEKIYEIKQRPLNLALPLIVRGFEQVLEIANIDKEIADFVEEITSTFWASSLSIKLKAKEHISPRITANTGTIVVRQSPHIVPQMLTHGLKAPLISTSANKSGEQAARTAKEFNEKLAIDALLDMPPQPQGGLASTIIEILPNKEIKVLREGVFDLNKLKDLGYTFV